MSAKPRFYYDNRFGDGTVVASSTAAGNFAPANVADFRAYTWWKPAVLPATLTVDVGVAKAADYAWLFGHDLKSVGASAEVRGSTDNFAASDVLVASGTPASDDPFLLEFASTSFRYWRWRFTGSTPPSIALAPVGAVLETPVWFEGEFDPLRRRVNGRQNKNENGHPLGRMVDFESWESQILLKNVAWSWARDTFIPAWKAHVRGAPFIFNWATNLYPADARLVVAGDELRIPHRHGSRADVAFDVEGVVP